MQQIRFPVPVIVAVLGLLALGVYWPGLQGAFFFDDGPSILFAPGVRLQSLSADSIRQAWFSGGAGPSGRPIAQLSFALNYYFSGYSPFAFKLTNLAIHGLCGVLVFVVSQRLLLTQYAAAARLHVRLVSSVITAAWLLHPIQLLPVLHVVQRMASLSALFLLAAFCLHIEGRRHAGRGGLALLLAAWIFVWPLSLLSKETGVLFPVFVLAWEVLLRRASVGHMDRFAKGLVALSVVVALAASVYLISGKAQWLWAGYEFRPFSMTQRLLTEGRVIWLYLGLMLLPRLPAFALNHDDIEISTGWLAPWTTLTAILGLLALALFIWRIRARAPIVAFGIAWFLLGHLIESTFLPLEIAHEHRNYLPFFGVALAAGGGLLYAIERGTALRAGCLGLAAVVLLYLSFITALRAHQYGDELRRTQLEAQYHPASARAQHEAGAALAGLPEANFPDSAINTSARNYFGLASRIDPSLKISLLGLISLDCKSGVPVARGPIDELSRRLRDTPFAPGDRGVLYTLKEMSIAGPPCLARPEVERLFEAAIDNASVSDGVRAILYSWRADYRWLRERDLPGASQALAASLKLNPHNGSNRLKWAQLILISGDKEQARRLLLELQGLDLSAEERGTLGELLATVNMTHN
jgi:hypothetical protein